MENTKFGFMNEPIRLLFLCSFMSKISSYLIAICAIALTTTTYGQVVLNADKLYNEALKLKAKKQHKAAYQRMNDAIRANSGFKDAYSKLGEWYYTDHNYNKAIEVFTSASQKCKNGYNTFALPLAKAYLGNYQPTQALQLIVSRSIGTDKNSIWHKLKANGRFMQQAMNNRWKDTARNMGIRINTPYPEMYPSISADTQTLYFTRSVNNIDEDFFRSTIDSCGGWFTAKNLGTPANTLDQEASQFISADEHYLFFMRCENRSENGWERGGCDLYMAYTVHKDSNWSVPQSFGATINTPAYEGMPCLSADNRELFFVSNKEGGYGGLDIWVSTFENGLWQEPRNLGPEINTAGNETSPFLHIDNNTLYFASDGHVGLGGIDLYTAQRVKDTIWSSVKNLGIPFNSPADDNSICITVDGQRALWASDRDSVTGNFDLYEMKMPEALRPTPVVKIKGIAYDSLTKDKLNYASIYIRDPLTGNDIYHFTSNRGDASYMITLPKGKQYGYYADRIGYLAMEGTITVPDADSINEMAYNIALLPQDYQAPINDSLILTLNFPINSKDLTDSAKSFISDAIAPWLMDSGFQIIVNSYTDNTGTPIINEELSYTRARLVAESIADCGILPEYIRYAGWGEAAPVASNDSEEGRFANRRVEVIIRR